MTNLHRKRPNFVEDLFESRTEMKACSTIHLVGDFSQQKNDIKM